MFQLKLPLRKLTNRFRHLLLFLQVLVLVQVRGLGLEQGGFGGKLINRAMSAQLGAAFSFDWAEDSIMVTLKIDRQSLEA